MRLRNCENIYDVYYIIHVWVRETHYTGYSVAGNIAFFRRALVWDGTEGISPTAEIETKLYSLPAINHKKIFWVHFFTFLRKKDFREAASDGFL